MKITRKASADSPIARRREQAKIENGLIASRLGYTLLRNRSTRCASGTEAVADFTCDWQARTTEEAICGTAESMISKGLVKQ